LLEVWLQNVFGHAVAQFVEPICECHNVWWQMVLRRSRPESTPQFLCCYSF
jgi:hypothetical protein